MTWVGIVKDANTHWKERFGDKGLGTKIKAFYSTLRQDYGHRNKQIMCIIDRGQASLACDLSEVEGCDKRITNEYFDCVEKLGNESTRSINYGTEQHEWVK